MSYFRANIEAIDGYTPGEQPSDMSIIKLNTNENPYPPSPHVMAAIRAITPDQLRRYPHPMGKSFREAAARVFGITPDHILCGNGMDDILNMAVRAFSGPEAALVYPVPTYTLYAVLGSIQASVVREVPWHSGYSLPIKELAAADGSVTFLANPNSPTGTYVPVDQMKELADSLRGVLCIDEAYVDFADADCLKLACSRPNVLVMRTLSKGYSLAGLRFGFAVGHPDLIEGLVKVKDSYNVDAIAIAAATAAISDQEYREQTRRKVIAERIRLVGNLEQLGLHSLPSAANFIFTRATDPGAEELYESLKARNILVRYFKRSGLSDFLRISIGTPEQNDTLVATLTELLHDRKQQKQS